MMDEACRSDKHLGDGQVMLLTCFNFRYVCGALRILFAAASFACVHTVRPLSLGWSLFFLLAIFTLFSSLVSSFLSIFLWCHFFPSMPIPLPCMLFCFLYSFKFLKPKGIINFVLITNLMQTDAGISEWHSRIVVWLYLWGTRFESRRGNMLSWFRLFTFTRREKYDKIPEILIIKF